MDDVEEKEVDDSCELSGAEESIAIFCSVVEMFTS
jgi:hypothetical protein